MNHELQRSSVTIESHCINTPDHSISSKKQLRASDSPHNVVAYHVRFDSESRSRDSLTHARLGSLGQTIVRASSGICHKTVRL